MMGVTMKKFLKKNLPRPVVELIKKQRRKNTFYRNINIDPANEGQKRALISYITDPLETNLETFDKHTNVLECAQIIKTFIDMGFCIDLAHCQDERNLPAVLRQEYDVIFGLGFPFYHAGLKNPGALKIMYLTEAHPDFSVKQEMERTQYFYLRHGRKVGLYRSQTHYKKEDIDMADYAVLVGNELTAGTYPGLAGRLSVITPTGLINKRYVFKERDCARTRKNYVWFGSYGAIHKGLDILIDIFRQWPDYNLYICGLYPEEEKLFSITGTNIKNLGFVNVNSDKFLDLVQDCSFVILPSCSEGMATSLLTCMNHGLIPVITRETGIDLLDFGFYLDDFRVETVARQVKLCSELDIAELERQHRRVFDYSREHFNISAYSKQFSRILRGILQDIKPADS